MKSVLLALVILIALGVFSPIDAADWLPGRYEGMILGQGNHVFILDTREGHCWGFSLNEAKLLYYGRVYPGKRFGEVLGEKTELTQDELQDQLEAIQAEIEKREKTREDEEKAVETRKELQEEIARDNLRREIKTELKEAIEKKDLSDDVKEELKGIVDGLE